MKIQHFLAAMSFCFLMGCATSGIPELPTADAHRYVAQEHMHKARELKKRYDPDAKVAVGRSNTNQAADIGAGVVVTNPTTRYLTEAKAHAEKAEAHLEAAERLEESSDS